MNSLNSNDCSFPSDTILQYKRLFPFLLIMFRHILASMHFNENIHRETKLSKDGEKYIAVTYPKFKLGEEVVREVASPPTYGKFHDLACSCLLCKCFFK